MASIAVILLECFSAIGSTLDSILTILFIEVLGLFGFIVFVPVGMELQGTHYFLLNQSNFAGHRFILSEPWLDCIYHSRLVFELHL